MFGYALSVAVAFIFFGVIFNIIKKINSNYDVNEVWFLIVVASIFWFIAIPLLSVVVILFLLKLVTDKIADFILKRVKK